MGAGPKDSFLSGHVAALVAPAPSTAALAVLVLLMMQLAAVMSADSTTFAAAKSRRQLLKETSDSSSTAQLQLPYSESVLNYWHETLPSAPMPAILRNRLTPLARGSKGDLLRLMAASTSTLPASAPPAICEAANLFCDWKSLTASVHPNRCDRIVGYTSFHAKTSDPDASTTTTSTAASDAAVEEHGGFFRERELFQGAKIKLIDQHDDMPRRSFLPRDLAQVFPFGLQKLPQLLQKFGIPSDSYLAGSMTRTLKACEETPMRGETVSCATSIEDMADFAVSDLQSNKVEVLTFSRPTQHYAEDETFVVLDMGLKADVHQKYVSCHEAMFLYDVYHCHDISNTKVYAASLRAASDGVVTHAVALCHMDTSQWNPMHVAFYDLGNKPGDSEACHWIGDNDVVFVPSSAPN